MHRQPLGDACDDTRADGQPIIIQGQRELHFASLLAYLVIRTRVE